jgi:hypothetical protein
LTKLKNTIKYVSALATVLAVAPVSVFAVDTSIDLTKIDGKWAGLSGITVQKVLVFAINSILIASGIVAFFFLLVGGMQWILAGGDKEGTEKARKRITAALVGLAVVFSAYALALLVEAIFGVSILTFNIPKIV